MATTRRSTSLSVNPNFWRWFIAAAVGIAGTVFFHLAQFTSRFDTFFGDRGDPRGVVYFCEHWYQSLLGKADLLSPGIFYPTRGALAYTDLLLGLAIPYSIVRALGLDMFTSVEIVIIGLNLLNFFACFILLNRSLAFGPLPSAAGALFFAFNSPKLFQLTHLQLQYVLFLPLICILVISLVRQLPTVTQKRAFVLLSLAGLLLNLQLLTAFYHAWFFVFWLFLFLALTLVFRRTRIFILDFLKKYWRAVAGSFAVFLVGLIPFLLIYLPTLRIGNWYSYENVSEMIPEWWSMISMGDGNYLWGWLSAAVRPKPVPTAWNELHVGVGLIPSVAWIGITIYALRLFKPKSEDEGGSASEKTRLAFFAVMVLATSLFFLLGFKYGNESPWFFVYKFFPGAAAIRAMSRYVIFLALPMAIGFAFILDRAMKRFAREKNLRRRQIMTFAVVLLAASGAVEQFGVFKFGGTGFSKKAERAYLASMAAKLPGDCKAFYVAPGRPTHSAIEYQDDGMMISILTGIPTLNGASSQFPPHWSMYVVTDPGYETHVKNWIAHHKLEGNICRLDIGPQVEAFESSVSNPISDPAFFVSQQYRDLLDREPAAEEIGRWQDQINKCQTPGNACDKAQIALELLRSTGYEERGAFIFRLYVAAFGRMPSHSEFNSAMKHFNAAEDKRLAQDEVVAQLIGSSEWESRYEASSIQQLAVKLGDNIESVTGSKVNLSYTTKDPKELLLKFVEDEKVKRLLANRAFVLLEYFAYLRRDPDSPGYAKWLNDLDTSGDYRVVTSGFIGSLEYKERFGVVKTGN